MVLASNAQRARPLSELNTTPLIDVMLVLLVMFIVTIPVATHSLEYSLPGERVRLAPDPVKNRLVVTADDEILWNGTPVSEAQLTDLLTRAAALDPEPQLQLAPDAAASYAKSARVLRLVKLSGTANVGFVGNERYHAFGR